MKKALTHITNPIYYYDSDGSRHNGAPDAVKGNLSDIRGNLTGRGGEHLQAKTPRESEL